MKILMLTSESVPFSKTGGLADVVNDLSSALANEKNDVRVLVPSYGSNKVGRLLTELEIPILGNIEKLQIRQKKVGKVIYYLLCHPLFTERSGIYGDTSFTPYKDNFLRYTLLNLAPFALMDQLNYYPDIIHCNDWATGLFPYFLYQNKQERFKNIKTIFTIHNLAYQGIFPKMQFLQTLKPARKELFKDNQINMMQTGIAFADRITTVSPTYSQEIQTETYGEGMKDLLIARSSRLSGILNGIDTKIWNPKTDPFLSHNFDITDFSGKCLMKTQLQKKFNLEITDKKPLFVMITRLASQKGIEVLFQVLEEILVPDNLQLLIIGTGNKEYEDFLLKEDKLYKNLSVNIIFNNELAHQAEAAADFFLMPSLYEPCGLNQMFSARYGALVLAHSTGGLKDTVIDIHEQNDYGTGLLIDEVTPNKLVGMIQSALRIYKSDKFNLYRKNAMSKDFSWNTSAKKYIKVYNETKGVR